ncbi:MAG TPA: SDR family NAD(P)-dependent oxidoreductase [Thermoanaerobaculia bacterium]|nr:SDR family NAD(P)-dependent oxidoreductase [Thermoanaerobaculia bacterium]
MRAILTGASSGIGLALARELSGRGYELALLARRTELLEQLASELKTKAIPLTCDVGDRASVHDAVRRAHEQLGGAFDVAVANAGVGISGQVAKLRIDDAEQTIRVNVLGMLYFFDAVIPPMIEAKKGRFVGVASLAGLRGLPSSATYSASKAAMQAFLEASRVELKPYGVGVTIVNPGFVKSPMTDKNRFHMPFLMSAEKAARIIADGIERGKRVVEFPLPMSLLVRLLRHLPDALYDRVMSRARA